jgi:tryptophan synthase alpha chain
MSALADVLARARAEDRSALIGYLPVGYPDVSTSIDAMTAMVAGGADVIEVGVPYSDPGMDGPDIQAAVDPAVKAGIGLRDVFAAVSAVRAAGAVPVVMSYWNPLEKYGVRRFAADLAAAGGAGAITPDLIPEEAAQWIAATDVHDLDRVFLLAPSSTDARILSTVAASRGFVYAASRCASDSECPMPTRQLRWQPSPTGSSWVRLSCGACSIPPTQPGPRRRARWRPSWPRASAAADLRRGPGYEPR